MPLTLPAELKKITPYIRRAEELDRDKSNAESRLVSFYCRQHAVHTGIALAQSPGGKTALGNILNDLEGEKKAMAAFTREESKFLCRQFADKIFTQADEEDRTGKASKSTAKTFYAAATFLEILNQFYNQEGDEEEEQNEISKKVKYAKWKSIEILKAFKEGRTPTPGGYDESDNMTEEENEQQDEFPTMPTAPPSAPFVPPSAPLSPPMEPLPPPIAPPNEGTEIELGPPPAYPASSSLPPPLSPTADDSSVVFVPTTSSSERQKRSSTTSKGLFGFGGGGGRKNGKKVSKESYNDAIELTRFALAALEAKDADLAANRLKQALHVLGK